MSVKLITYDISDDDNRNACREKIESYESCISIGQSDYLVDTTESTKTIRNGLSEFIDTDTDELFVCKVHANEWAEEGLEESKREWIEMSAS